MEVRSVPVDETEHARCSFANPEPDCAFVAVLGAPPQTGKLRDKATDISLGAQSLVGSHRWAVAPFVVERFNARPKGVKVVRHAAMLARSTQLHSTTADKATSGFEPLLPEKTGGQGDSLEPLPPDVPELNPLLARILERVKANEAERQR
jgi:hypothetical protein